MKASKLFFPLALLYGAATSARNLLYDAGILRSEAGPVPVVCIGNLSTGGTGKTPHVEYLLRMFPNRRLAVLSRGYGRTSTGFLLVTPQMTAGQAGDECLQVKRKFPGTPVAVSADRREGLRQLMQSTPPPEWVLMDDGFQHRRVKPRLSILLTDHSNLFTRDFLLPAGHLREGRRNYKRADVIIVTRCPEVLTDDTKEQVRREIAPLPGQKLLFSSLKSMPPVGADGHTLNDDDCANLHVTGFCGLASPRSFIAQLKNKFKSAEHLSFPDHHPYPDEDIRRIVNKFEGAGPENRILLTTEKDFVKVGGHPAFAGKPLYYMPVEVHMDKPEQVALQTEIETTCST